MLATISDSTQPLRGKMCRCECGETFGSVSAFDRHQSDDGERPVCLPVRRFTEPTGKHNRPKLVLHPDKRVWVTKLDDRYSDE